MVQINQQVLTGVRLLRQRILHIDRASVCRKANLELLSQLLWSLELAPVVHRSDSCQGRRSPVRVPRLNLFLHLAHLRICELNWLKETLGARVLFKNVK